MLTFDVPTVIRLQREGHGPWLVARLLVDAVDIKMVRPTTPIFDAILATYPNLPDGPGPATLQNPRLALHATGALIMGSTVWDKPMRQLVGLPLDDNFDLAAPLIDVALRLLGLPRN